MNLLQLSSLLALGIISAAAAASDIKARIIPNALCGLALAVGLAFALAGGGASGMMVAALHVAAALVGGMALFAMGWIGGGDAKFYAALAAWFPLSSGFYYLLCVSLAGIALLLVWWVAHKFMLRTSAELKADSPFRKLPYGVAIGAGATIGHLVALTAR